eukprot:983120-Pleurochrysis_carterae.AAC.2
MARGRGGGGGADAADACGARKTTRPCVRLLARERAARRMRRRMLTRCGSGALLATNPAKCLAGAVTTVLRR